MPSVVEDALKQSEIPIQATGVYVQEVGGGPVMAVFNPSTPFNPASTMKLVTSSAALELLGPTYTWKTQVYADGKQAGDALLGDLIFKGNGDPKLVVENFWLFLRRIRAQGIREIRGNLVLDRSAFQDTPFDPAAFDGDPTRTYNVGPDALLLNYKALGFRFLPDPMTGKVHMIVDPPLAGYPVVAPKLSKDECGNWRAKLSPVIESGRARFAGTYSAACGDRTWYFHPYEMTSTQYFAAVFRHIWSELGGTFHGEVRDGLVPASGRLITEWESVSLSEVIRDINKYSNNVMARQLLLTIAGNVTKLSATPDHGAAVVRTWLTNKGIDAPELSIENGSGLSRIERISPATMARVLSVVFQSPTMPEFMSSLPVVGYDGTMRQRLRTQNVAGYAHIKTGMLNEVRAIAGYVLAASGKRYVVVFMINHPNAAKGQMAQDALLQWIHEQG
ncbi:MAG TPA: D-alanyl-D-alanine carboxypeptidase/D-alanyl-D-alanine-endopeptidase [Noviherbaspirillum sp.]|nr:D-alanyl-D-alanine carboxypeptidase/D-alanyl-D-alanine-endopeptidase [Noviherbaspirillum sp.]HEV2609499.1 D-alanyl-D-alanine carboxypeptidase/D-alanyl-D-alanine-endopeptidase [Noviherbaspirillum sp.]